MTELQAARAVADAVLYEGYALYPYRASSSKNQVRFQWGVLMPGDVVSADPSERAESRTEVVVEGRSASLALVVRFLQVQPRTVEPADGSGPVASLEVDDTVHVPWDEAVEREVELEVPLAAEGRHTFDAEIPGGEETETLADRAGGTVGRLVRTRQPLQVAVEVEVRRPVSPYGVAVVAVVVRNATPDAGPTPPHRPAWLRRSLVATHVLLRVDDGAFVSMLDPPQWASGFVAACRNDATFPVLMGEPDARRVMLSSPIILYDHPQLAPESESSFFDALEVDELLSLRTMTLSDEEKREVRGTDPRTAALLDQVESMPPDLWERLHGTVRYVDAMTRSSGAAEEPDVPWWDPGADSSVDPETDTIAVAGVQVTRGSRVILRPGVRRADAYDMFLAGRTATVAAVFHDVDEGRHLAVTIDDDPGSDLKDTHGRYLYFAPDEVEPLAGPGTPGTPGSS